MATNPDEPVNDLEGFLNLCSFEELQQKEALAFTLRDPGRGVHDVAVVWDGEAVYAIEDWCPHADGMLHAGAIHPGRIICPVHEAVFDLRTGVCLDRYTHDTQAYQTRVHQGRVYIYLPGEEPWTRGGFHWDRGKGLVD
jgi:nitrite reductase/ring-hydroxylating ferredoxin subunit